MYTIKNTQGHTLATFDTIEEARAAIADTSNVIHYSAEAIGEFCNATGAVPAHSVVTDYTVCTISKSGYTHKAFTNKHLSPCVRFLADAYSAKDFAGGSIHARCGSAVGAVNYDGTREGVLVRLI